MSIVKLVNQAKKFIASRDEARSTAEKAHTEAEKRLVEATLLSQTVNDCMQIFRLSEDKRLREAVARKAITLLGTSVRHLWDLLLISEVYYADHSEEFRKKEKVILSKVTIGWLMSLEKEIPQKYRFNLKQRFGAELRQLFEREAQAATSYEEYELVYEHYKNLPVDTSGFWDVDHWRPDRPKTWSGHAGF